MRVRGNDGFGVPARHCKKLVAGRYERFQFPEQPVAQVHARDRRGDVLAASAGVQARSVWTDDSSEPGLVVEVVGRAVRRRGALLRDHLRDSLGDRARNRVRDDAGLVQHDDGRLVDLIEKLDRSPAAAEHFVDVHAHDGLKLHREGCTGHEGKVKPRGLSLPPAD